MTGLIHKDAVCLKKNLKMFIFVGLSVMAVAIMFAISCRMGNISEGIKNYNSEDSMTKELLISVINISMYMISIIPIAFIANIIDCFKEDSKAGFHNTVFSIPLNSREIVGSRYLSMLLYILVGLCFTLVTQVGISVASDRIQFNDMYPTALFFTGIMLMYMSIVIPCVYLCGSKKSEVICVVPFVIAILAGIVYIVVNEDKMPETEVELAKAGYKFVEFVQDKGFLVFGISILCIIGSYFTSVMIIKKRRWHDV